MVRGKECQMPRVSRYGPNVHPPVFSQGTAEEMDRLYRGKWVAIDDDRIVAAGDDGVEVFRRAKSHGAADPVLFAVPLHPERAAFY